MEQNLNYIIGAIIGIFSWFIKSQNDRRYSEQKDINNQVTQNTNSIIENKANDLASTEAFNTYKKTIESDFKKTENILNSILESIKDLNSSFNDLRIEIEKLKK